MWLSGQHRTPPTIYASSDQPSSGTLHPTWREATIQGGCQNTLGKIQRLFQAYSRKIHGIFSSRCWPLICAFTHNVSCAGNLCTRQNLSRFTRMKTDPAPGVFPLFS